MKRSIVVLLALPFIVATQTTSTEAAEGGGAILRSECLPNDPVRLAEEAAVRQAAEARRQAEQAARRQAEEDARRQAEAAARKALEEQRSQAEADGQSQYYGADQTVKDGLDGLEGLVTGRSYEGGEGMAVQPELDPEPMSRPDSSESSGRYAPRGGEAAAESKAFEVAGVAEGKSRDAESRRRSERKAKQEAERARAEAEASAAAAAEAAQAARHTVEEAPPMLAEPVVGTEITAALEDDTVAPDVPRGATSTGEDRWDWGASLFLSNDDSMSLASAQRVLYSLKRGVGLDAGDVRPHELLNYFSFDTAEPRKGDAFALTAAAEAHGDTLAMTMAVRGAEPERRPLDLTAVVDVSGSMRSDGRLDTVKRALHLVEDQLEEGDRFDLVTFSNRQCVALEDFVVGRDDPALLKRAIDGMAPTGGTNLNVGLNAGYELAEARTTDGRNQRVMLMTDANLNVGVTDHGLVADVARAYEDRDIRLTGVGVGRDFNDAFLDKLTDTGKGAYVYLGSDAVVDRLFGVGFPALVETVAHDVQFELELPDSLAMERFYGEEVSTVAADVQPIHYYAGTSQVFFQDLHMGDVDDDDRVRLTVRYTDAVTGKKKTQAFETTVGALLDADPRNVHKARALMAFSDVVMDQAMGQDPCGSMVTYSQRAALLTDDAEIGYVNGLLEGMCPDLEVPVAYKLTFQTDRPLAQASLDCGGERQGQSLSASDTVAAFQAQPGTCQLEVSDGSEQWTASVAVPTSGGSGRCVVRGRRLSCR